MQSQLKQSKNRTEVFTNIFHVHFSSFPFRFFVCKSKFVSLEAHVKQEPKKTDALRGQTSPHCEKLIYMLMVLVRRESSLARNKMRGGTNYNLILSGTVSYCKF